MALKLVQHTEHLKHRLSQAVENGLRLSIKGLLGGFMALAFWCLAQSLKGGVEQSERIYAIAARPISQTILERITLAFL